MTRALLRSLAIIICLDMAATSLKADAVTELRTILARFRGTESVKATVEITRSRHSKGRFQNDEFEGSASAEVEASPEGMRAAYSRSLLSRAADEGAAHQFDSHRRDGTFNAMAEMLPETLSSLIDAAPSLLRLVERSRLIEQHNGVDHGRKVRFLTLDLPPSGSGSEAGEIAFHEDHLTVAVGADGVPLNAERIRKGSAGLLFIHVDTVRTQVWSFAVRGDHLLASRFEDFSVVSGPGQRGEARSVWTVRPDGMP
jgi:hypothetical protein